MFTVRANSRTHAWIAVMSLGFSAFIFNTTEFVPISLLSSISYSFGMPKEGAGIMITVYAWIVALMSLPLILLLGNVERKRLLITTFIVFVASHILCFFASSFNMLLVGRIGVALAHSVFWSITSALAIRVAPAGKKSQALAILATGTSLATILGLPLGRIIGEWLGWQITFLSIGVTALFVLIILIVVLPKLPSVNTGSAKSLPIIFKRPALVGVFIITAIIVSGNFALYSFIEQYAEDIMGFSKNEVTFLLLFFGFAGVTGSFLFGKINARHPLVLWPLAMGILAISLILFYFSKSNLQFFFVLFFFWGVSFTCMSLSQQVKVLDLASDATDISMAIYSGIFNIGIGGGALIGKLVIQYYGVKWIGFVGGAVALIAFLLGLYLTLRYKKTLMESARDSGNQITAH